MFKWTKRFRCAANAIEKDLAEGTFGIAKPPPGAASDWTGDRDRETSTHAQMEGAAVSRGPGTRTDDLCDREAGSWDLASASPQPTLLRMVVRAGERKGQACAREERG